MTNNFTSTHPIETPNPQTIKPGRYIHAQTQVTACSKGRGNGKKIQGSTEPENYTHGKRHTTRNKYQCTTILKHACMNTPAQVQGNIKEQNKYKDTYIVYISLYTPTQE